ncbi:MAG: RagB/SusD family nutrient uptake outer membrane protein [Tannerella sp.]|jgi:hypothetical protein|nr:RagB/SusD family nutrient uptake outer membrane protein [Tannerella sp.]
MKTKSIISILIGSVMMLSLSSCFNLDETIYDKIPADSFGKTEAEIESIIGPAYNTLKKYFPSRWLYLSECSGEMAINPTRRGGDWFDGGVYRDLHMHTWTAQTNTFRDCWDGATQSISSCNLIYETIHSAQALSDENKSAALAEIRGVRAFWLYALMDAFGNIPLAVDFNDTNLPATKSRQEAFDYIISELTDIKDMLRSDVSGASYGKFTKGAAYTLLAKMYLNADAWGVSTNKSNWQEVVAACDAVMGLNYILEPNWKTNFQVKNEDSREAIFGACYSANDTEDQNTLHFRTLHYKDNIALGGTWSSWNGICALTDYAKLFEVEDQRLEASFLTGEMKDPATGEVLITAHERPLIHYIDVIQIEGSQYEGSTWGQVNQEDGFRCHKWPYDKGTLGAMENDFHIFRLADVYLMKAEALVRMGGDNALATQLVNTIRERGFGDATHNYTSVTLDDIFRERKLEFAWECHSRQDCIRFGTYQNARYLKLDTHGKDYLNIFPVPQTAIDANRNLTQNPGY